MFGRKKKWFENVPYLYRGYLHTCLVRRSNQLYEQLEKNGFLDEYGNIISDDDTCHETTEELARIDTMIQELYKVPF